MKFFTSTLTKRVLFFIFSMLMSELSFGQKSIDAIGTPVTEDFNTLTTSYDYLSWLDDSTLPNWYAKTDATSPILEYTADDGSYDIAGLYSYGSYESTDRAFGYFPSDEFTGMNGVGKGYVGWRLKNNTGKSIGSIRVVWTGEQWRKAVDANIQYIKLSYQIGTTVTDLSTGTYIETNSTFASPIHDANSAIVLDGNASANRTTGITFEVNVVIPAGDEIMLRWDDLNDVANHTLAIDDVSFTATKESQTILFNPLDEKTYGDANFDLTATASSELDVSYGSSNALVATIIGNTVTITGAGTTTIFATQLGNENYAAADTIFRILNVKPQIPVSTQATSITSSSFQANWNSASGAEGYYLFYGTDPTLATYTGASVGSVTTFNITGLLHNTTYYYRMKSINTGIYSDYSNIISVTTDLAIQTYDISATPAFVSANLNWSNGSLASRALFMKEGSGIITDPTAKRYTASTNWNAKGTQLGTSGYYCIYYGTDTSLTLTDLYPGKLYTVQAFEFTGTTGKEVFLTTVTGENNPIAFSTWGTTTWTNTADITTAENFTTAARWDHATVPTAALHPAVKVYIDGNCEISTDAVANNLTINASHDAINPKLTINTAASLMVSDTLINMNGASAILLKSGASVPNGTLIFRNAPEKLVQATVEMYSKATKVGSTYKWQFFGVPVSAVAKYPTFVDGVNYVRRFNEAGWWAGFGTDKHWIQEQNGATLTPFTGYEMTQATAQTYSFTGDLVNNSFDSGKLPYTYTDEVNRSQYPGQHLIGNPYTAAINISDIEFGSADEGIIENSVYLYNTGSLADWTAAGEGTASLIETSTVGKYIVIPKNVAGRGEGIPGQIPSMQAFLVKVKSDNAAAWVNITYPTNNTVTTLGKNTTAQRAPSADLPSTRIDVIGATSGDRMWIFTEPTCTRGFDNGWDGYKEISTATVSKLFANESSGKYQINSVDDIDNSAIGFVAGTDTDYTFTFTHQNNEAKYPTLYLFDAYTGEYINIAESGTQYSFTSSNTLETESRFKIVTQIDETTEISRMANSGLKLFNSHKNIIIHNPTAHNGTLELFDLSGRIVQIFTFSANATTTIPTSISVGSYIAKAYTKTDKITLPILFK